MKLTLLKRLAKLLFFLALCFFFTPMLLGKGEMFIDGSGGWEFVQNVGLDLSLSPTDTVEDWLKIVENVDLNISERRSGVLILFQRHIKVGMTLSKMSELLKKPKWIHEDDVTWVDAMTGYIPVHWGVNDSIFCIRLFPELIEDNQRVFLEIYLRFSGEFSKDLFYRTIRGERIPNWDPRLREVGFFGVGLRKQIMDSFENPKNEFSPNEEKVN